MVNVKSPGAFRTISEVSELLDVPAHVLRFWETKFAQVRPVKRGGGRRYYRPEDVALLTGIRELLYREGLTIKGVQKVLREKGARHVAGTGGEGEATAASEPAPASAPVPAPLPAAPDAATPGPIAASNPAAALAAAIERLEELRARLGLDPSEGMEIVDPAPLPLALPAAGRETRAAGRGKRSRGA